MIRTRHGITPDEADAKLTRILLWLDREYMRGTRGRIDQQQWDIGYHASEAVGKAIRALNLDRKRRHGKTIQTHG